MTEQRRPREEDTYPTFIMHLQARLPRCRLWQHGKKFRDEHGVWRNGALAVGMADLVGWVEGRWLEVEVKTPRGAQEESQRLHQALVELHGGIYVLAKSPEEAEAQIRAALERLSRGPCAADGKTGCPGYRGACARSGIVGTCGRRVP